MAHNASKNENTRNKHHWNWNKYKIDYIFCKFVFIM